MIAEAHAAVLSGGAYVSKRPTSHSAFMAWVSQVYAYARAVGALIDDRMEDPKFKPTPQHVAAVQELDEVFNDILQVSTTHGLLTLDSGIRIVLLRTKAEKIEELFRA